jgi:nicotinamide phosphoribosyltransferase
MLTAFPKGLVATVSDSYDIFNACKELWGTQLKDVIMSREGCCVVRPDSGELPDIVVKVLDALGEKFETTKTSTGHKLLPPQIRMIQGDGISIDSLSVICEHMAKNGWAVDNSAFGSGGALLQKLNRDTMKCAFKCCSITVGDTETDVFKDPITDPGKKSKKGRLTLEKNAQGVIETITEGKGDKSKDMLVEVFRDGALLVDYAFSDIRAKALIP